MIHGKKKNLKDRIQNMTLSLLDLKNFLFSDRLRLLFRLKAKENCQDLCLFFTVFSLSPSFHSLFT